MGTVTRTATLSAYPTSYDTEHVSYYSISSSYPITNAYTDSSSSTYCQVNWTRGTNAETYVYLKFDFSSIPSGARIDSVTASAKGYVNTTSSKRVTSRQMQLATGTTLKGSALTISTSTSAQTFTSVGTWTRSELLDAGIRYYIKRGSSNATSDYQLRMYGATMTVTYEWEETTYTVTVNNSTSVAVTADPAEVVAGDSCEIEADTIQDIVVTDNGVDVTNQFVPVQESGEYSVENVTTTYGFSLNSNNYYESNNKAVASSCALARVIFQLPTTATVTFSVINYAEATYDYGLLSNVDTHLSTDASADSSNVFWSGKNNNSASVQIVTYNMSAGTHTVDVKFFKDQYTDSNNDSLQFTVAIVLTGSVRTLYRYTIVNVQANHVVVVTDAQSNSAFLKVNGTWRMVTVYQKSNGTWNVVSDPQTVLDTVRKYYLRS